MKNCTKCKILKPLTDFSKSGSRQQAWCKTCSNIHNRARYRSDSNRRSLIKSLNNTNRDKNQLYVFQYLQANPCSCGQTNILTLQFDHLSDKKFNISQKIARCSLETLQQEIAKCQVLCANCHSIKSAYQLNSWKIKMVDPKRLVTLS